MGLNIKNEEVERLATEVSRLTGESKTEAIRRALKERKERLTSERRRLVADAFRFLEEEVWPTLPPEVRGKPVTKAEREAILGYGPEGF